MGTGTFSIRSRAGGVWGRGRVRVSWWWWLSVFVARWGSWGGLFLLSRPSVCGAVYGGWPLSLAGPGVLVLSVGLCAGLLGLAFSLFSLAAWGFVPFLFVCPVLVLLSFSCSFVLFLGWLGWYGRTGGELFLPF